MKNKSPKKVLILTLPLTNGNYGGIMQAYALQLFMRKNGYDAYTQMKPLGVSKARLILSVGKRLLRRAMFRKGRILIPDVNEIIFGNMAEFIAKYLRTVDIFSTSSRVKKNALDDYDMIVVGSDQVWRSRYGDVKKYLLDFAADANLTKISYAASFGVDTREEYDERLVLKTRDLAQNFDAISVRESSAVSIVKDIWMKSATQHVDPTLLIPTKHYIGLVDGLTEQPEAGELFSYLLDSDSSKTLAVNRIAAELNLSVTSIMPERFSGQEDIFDSPDTYRYPSPIVWLARFYRAGFIITDSFHGCAFSIIFNKPFIAIGNESRGLSRFVSILAMFGLEDRLVLSAEEITKELLTKDINWDLVNSIREKELRRSISFIGSYSTNDEASGE